MTASWRNVLILVVVTMVVTGLIVFSISTIFQGQEDTKQEAKVAVVKAKKTQDKKTAAVKKRTDRVARRVQVIRRVQVRTQRILVTKGILKRGRRGLTGGTGPTGRTGPRGPRGRQGVPGKDAPPAVSPNFPVPRQGPKGDPGKDGRDGVDGKPVGSFSFTDATGLTQVCTDPEQDTSFACVAQPVPDTPPPPPVP